MSGSAGVPGLAAIGRFVRARAAFPLMLAALAWGVLREAARPRSWRRTVRTAFRRTLRQTIGGGLTTALVMAVLTGLALISQALYWLGLAGELELEGTVLATVLVQELTPLLIGIALLGRSGPVIVMELGQLQTGGQIRALVRQGIDPLLLLVLPCACAFAVSSFTLGVLFVLVALLIGYATGSLLGSVQESVWSFLNGVLEAIQGVNFFIFPAKMLCIGFLIGLIACLTGLTARPGGDAEQLLPRGFVRGVLAIMLTSLVLSLAA